MTSTRHLVGDTDLPEHEAVRLLATATGQSATSVRMGFVIDNPQVVETYQRYVARRTGGEPLQYIEGTVPFGEATIGVDARVLIPRPETEEILGIVAESAVSPRVVVDLCTGSGALAIALALQHQASDVHATDVDPRALEVAATNADANGVSVHLHVGDLYQALPPVLAGTVDVLVSNPPYVSDDEYMQVAPEVMREPRHALVSGPTGSEFVDRIAAGASAWLAPGGLVVCEISEFQAEEARTAFAHLGGVVQRDLGGKERFVVGHRRVE